MNIQSFKPLRIPIGNFICIILKHSVPLAGNCLKTFIFVSRRAAEFAKRINIMTFFSAVFASLRENMILRHLSKRRELEVGSNIKTNFSVL